MATIELYKDKINSMSNYIEQAKNAVSDFCLDLSALKSKILGINSSVCDNVVSSISSSSQTQEQQIAGLEATQKEVNTFIDLTVNRDNSAADAVSKAKDEFYKEYSYLKPDSEKSDWERFCDDLKKVGDWCKEHWKEIMIAIEIIVAVVCFCVPGLQGFGALILENMLKGLIFGLVIGAAVGGISGYAQNGVDGILGGILNGAKDGALLGAAFGGLGGVGSLSGKLFGCSTFMTGAFSVSSKLALGMMAFDITALANDFQNRLFQDTGIYLGLVNPYIGGLISDLNHKAHSNSIYNAFQYVVSGAAAYSGGYVKTAACFVAGTLVATVNGLAAIETIKAGDYVLSTDPDTMKTEYKQVLETYIRKVDRLVHLIISGEEIITTVDHPFYVQGRGFIDAGNLLVGDKLVSSIGEDLLIENYNIEVVEELVQVYNFQVEDFHTYHVGKNGVLVHNAQYETDIGDYKGNRTKEQYEDLSKDPAHKNSSRPCDVKQGEMERNIGLSLEKAGKLDEIVRDPTGRAEFIDSSGQKWDIKSFNSNYPARKGGFTLNKAMESINGEINAGENVIVDTTNMSSEHIETLQNAVDTKGLTDNVIFWP